MELKIGEVVYYVSNHAQQRMESRGVSKLQLQECLRDIKSVRLESKAGLEDRYLVIGKNKVRAVVSKRFVVITVYAWMPVYHENKRKQAFNKKRRQIKLKVGNRFRDKKTTK